MEIPFHGVFDCNSNSYMNLADCLQASMDYTSVAEAFCLFPSEVDRKPILAGNSVAANNPIPATSNSPASPWSSSDEEYSGTSVKIKEDKVVGDGAKLPRQEQEKEKKKKTREPRFAFMTKSEVDILEDGYKWRKYGQKALKHSPYPRSYYRCTTQKCIVKKQVERSYENPTIVINTYEGQHNHPIPLSHRGTYAGSGMIDQPPLRFSREISTAEIQIIPHIVNHDTLDDLHQLYPLQPEHGLFQDVIPFFFNH